MGGNGESTLTDCLKGASRRVVSSGPFYFVFLGICAVVFIGGVIAGIHSVYVAGSRHAYGTYREIPLGMLIATYTFFVVTSTGLCLLSSIGHIFGVEKFVPIGKRAVFLSIITLLSGFLVIGLELENPLRLAIFLFLSPNLSSNIWWMGVLYSFETVLLIVEFIFLMQGKHKISATAGLLGIGFGVAAISNLGGVFAMLNGREFWYGPYLPVFFIASALLMGCAVITFFTPIAFAIQRKDVDDAMASSIESVAKLMMVMLAVVMFLTIWRMVSLTVGSPEKQMALNIFVSGPCAFTFWGLEITLGLIIPFALLLLSGGKRIGLMVLAAAFVIVCAFFARLGMVVGGEMVPLYWDLGVKEYASLHQYSPTWREILVVLAGAGFCGMVFLLGEKVFDGFAEEAAERGLRAKKKVDEK
jgi:molybdopterin-containing oxidoreductase family membrane subunit